VSHLSRDGKSHCHGELSLRNEGFCDTRSSALDDGDVWHVTVPEGASESLFRSMHHGPGFETMATSIFRLCRVSIGDRTLDQQLEALAKADGGRIFIETHVDTTA
jgi:hypothetical protein